MVLVCMSRAIRMNGGGELRQDVAGRGKARSRWTCMDKRAFSPIHHDHKYDATAMSGTTPTSPPGSVAASHCYSRPPPSISDAHRRSTNRWPGTWVLAVGDETMYGFEV